MKSDSARWSPLRTGGCLGSGSARSLLLALVTLQLLLARPVQAQGPGMSHVEHAMDWGRETFVLAEVLEYAPGAADRPVRYDLLGWTGGASHRIWAKVEGEHGTRSGSGSTEFQLLYGRLLTAWWDGQLGLKLDARYGEGRTRTRTSLALGIQGLAPGWFEVEPTLFVSQDGDVAASLKASYDLLITQRLVLQPRLETSLAVQKVPEFGIGSGLNDADLGLRLRYEFRREIAPYVGVSWRRSFAGTAELARAAGEVTSEQSLVAGLRLWY